VYLSVELLSTIDLDLHYLPPDEDECAPGSDPIALICDEYATLYTLHLQPRYGGAVPTPEDVSAALEWAEESVRQAKRWTPQVIDGGGK
jgi:hypothetical protein